MCEARSRREEKGGCRYLLGIEVGRRHLPVRRSRIPVEEKREAVRRPHFAERRRCAQAVVDGKEAHVDSLAREEVADEIAVRIATDARHDRRGQTQPCETGRDVARKPADEAGVGADLAQRCPELVRVEVDSHTPEHGDVDHARDLRTTKLVAQSHTLG